MPDDLPAYYATPGVFTTLGPFAEQLNALPNDVGALAHAVQMLLLHRFWAQAYSVEVTPERDKEQGLHGAEAMLSQAMKLAPARVGEVRLPDKRVIGNCRHFSTMLCACLRHKRVPARARCGFAVYFEPGKYVDHWVCEYWNVDESRWVQVDAQLDALQVGVIKPDFGPLDVPRDRFLVAGNVWQQIRAGNVDASQCGIAGMWGDWFVRGDLALDVASLQKVELLPWEPFGIAKAPQSAIPDTPELLALVDRVAELTALGDDASIRELIALAKTDERLRPPVRDDQVCARRRPRRSDHWQSYRHDITFPAPPVRWNTHPCGGSMPLNDVQWERRRCDAGRPILNCRSSCRSHPARRATASSCRVRAHDSIARQRRSRWRCRSTSRGSAG